MRKTVSTVLMLLLVSVSVFASGFQINEHGARGLGMGGAFTGLANDASAVYFNPAGITQLRGTHFSIGATYIAPMSTFTGPDPLPTESKLKKKYFTPATFYFTQSLGEKFSVGLGFNSPFGLGTEWDGNWVGKYKTTETEIRTFNVTPVVAYKVTDNFSVAAGFTVSYADVLIARKLQLMLAPPITPVVVVYPDANLELEGDDVAYGYALALFYKPIESLSLGLSFKSEIKYDFEGTATTTYDASVPAALVARFPKGDITAPLTTPMVLSFGAAYKVNENWNATADFQYNGWSSYKELAVTFKDMPTGTTNPSVSKRDFENSFIVRGGTEYRMKQGLALRAGLFYDKNPIKDERLDPTLPDADRLGLTAGLGYSITPSLSVDIAYLYLSFMDRTINTSDEIIPVLPAPQKLNGKYESYAHLFGINLNYSL